MLAIYTAALLCSSCDEAIYLYNSREVSYYSDSPDICFYHDVINKNENIANILDTFDQYNKNLLSNVKINNYTVQCSSNINVETAMPIEIPESNYLFSSTSFIITHSVLIILKMPCNIFRPPESIEPSIV
jgi:hypothetical protein